MPIRPKGSSSPTKVPGGTLWLGDAPQQAPQPVTAPTLAREVPTVPVLTLAQKVSRSDEKTLMFLSQIAEEVRKEKEESQKSLETSRNNQKARLKNIIDAMNQLPAHGALVKLLRDEKTIKQVQGDKALCVHYEAVPDGKGFRTILTIRVDGPIYSLTTTHLCVYKLMGIKLFSKKNQSTEIFNNSTGLIKHLLTNFS